MTAYVGAVKAQLLNESAFVRAVFSAPQGGATAAWQKVVVRPVVIKEKRHLQFSYFTAAQDITKNYADDALNDAIDELLALPFKNIHVQSRDEALQVHISKKGKVTMGRHATSAAPQPLEMAHDRQKQRILSSDHDESAAFLKAVGIMNANGTIKAERHDKYVQINEFLKLLAQTGAFDAFSADIPIHVVDFGCGNAYLTFALYHYLTVTLGLNVHMTGVDVKADLLARHREKAAALGWQHLTFEQAHIIDYRPATPPDVVVALHACDTATDEALAQGIGWQSHLIVTAPCCQHHLQAQLCNLPTPTPFRPVWQDGILSERMGDVLTDTFRAELLRTLGYKTDVVQFVSDAHTPKNLMIRAVKGDGAGSAKAARDYQQLKAYWGVTPYLETLVGDEAATLATITTTGI